MSPAVATHPHEASSLDKRLRSRARRLRWRARRRRLRLGLVLLAWALAALALLDAWWGAEGVSAWLFTLIACLLLLPGFVWTIGASAVRRVSLEAAARAYEREQPPGAPLGVVEVGCGLLHWSASDDPIASACARRAAGQALRAIEAARPVTDARATAPIRWMLAALPFVVLMAMHIAMPGLLITTAHRAAKPSADASSRPPAWSPVWIGVRLLGPEPHAGEDALLAIETRVRSAWVIDEPPRRAVLRVRVDEPSDRSTSWSIGVDLDADGAARRTLPEVAGAFTVFAEAEATRARGGRSARSERLHIEPDPSPAWREAVAWVIRPGEAGPSGRWPIDPAGDPLRLEAPPGTRIEIEARAVGLVERIHAAGASVLEPSPGRDVASARPPVFVRATGVIGETPDRLELRASRDDSPDARLIVRTSPIRAPPDASAPGEADLEREGAADGAGTDGSRTPDDAPGFGGEAFANDEPGDAPSRAADAGDAQGDARAHARGDRDEGADGSPGGETIAPGDGDPTSASGRETRDPRPADEPSEGPVPGVRTTPAIPGVPASSLGVITSDPVHRAAIERVPPEFRPLVAAYLARRERLAETPRTPEQEREP